ncbi:MAG TPA: SRPBCC family protein [Planctomycetota bacterium]|nr:SRPBCC family protein [Planctomycetota bacterium]
MSETVRHITVTINRPAAQVYEFASNPENLPQWASGLAGSISRVDGEWVSESPMGKVKIRFAEKNGFGVLDHDVVLPNGTSIRNPMRVVPHKGGSEVVFTLFRQPGVTDKKFADDAAWVEKDLNRLKSVVEK